MQTIEELSKKKSITAVAEEMFKEGIASKGVFCEVSSDSMRFLIREGEHVLIREEEPRRINIFDIAIYRYNGNLVMHRIIWKYRNKGGNTYIFKGDGIPQIDEPVDEDDIAGKVFAVRKARGLIRLDSFGGKALSLFAFFYSLRKIPFLLRIKINRALYKGFRLFIVTTKDQKLFNWFYRKYYILAIKCFVLFSNWFKEIETIYLRRQMASGKWEAGLSDIDLLLVIDKLPKNKIETFFRKFWKQYFMMKRLFPFLGEVEICTEDELNNWLGAAGVRQKESKSWRILLGRQSFREAKINPNLLQFKISCLNEVFRACWALSVKFSFLRHNNFISCIEAHKFANYIYDIIRYTEHLTANSVGSIETRDVFIDKFIVQNDDEELTRSLREFRSLEKFNRFTISKSLIFDIFCHLIKYLDGGCANLLEQFSSLNTKSSESRYRIIFPSEKADIGSAFDKDIYQACAQRIYTDNKNSIEAMISNSHTFTNHAFILLKNDLGISDIRRTCASVFDCLKGKDLFLLTERTLNCLNFSIFLESPFTYFDLIYQGNVDAGSNVGLRLLKPTDEILDLLLKENIVNFNLCLGMFAHNRTPVYLLYHSIANILRMRLALEQKLIVVTLKDALKYYKKYYPEFSFQLNLFEEKYLLLKMSQLDRLSAREIFYENFQLVKSALESMNENIIQ